MVSNTTVLEGPLAALREAEIDLIGDVAEALLEPGEETEQDRARLKEMAKDLRDLFFIVAVIGEFNAGKSSFINALVGARLLPTGITPTTEVIELIRFNETANLKPVRQNDALREWAHPGVGAPGVAIVDTPGTGSVFQRHETTAKAFLHRSDLVLFVLSAKRAFAETERLYLEMAKNYGKKIILVVNQVDLLDPSERTTVRRFIEGQVSEHLGLQPLLFMVSAKEALEEVAKAAPNPTAGGMDAVRAHLRGVFTESPPSKQKLLAQLETVSRVIDRHYEKATVKANLIKTDTSQVRDVQTELQQQSLGIEAQLSTARAEIDKVFVGLRQRGLNFLETNLSVRRVGRSVNRDKLQSEFQEVVIGRAIRDIDEATGDYINAVVDQSRAYWRSVIDRLNKMVDLLDEEVGGLDANVYAEQRESLEQAIKMAEAEMKSYSSGRLVDEIQTEFQTNMNGFTLSMVAGVGGVAAVVAAIAVPGPLAGAAAAAFAVALPVAALGGVAAYRYYRRISNDLKSDFNARVDRLMQGYHTALDDLTRKERNRLTQYGTGVLTPIFSRLETLDHRYADQVTKFDSFRMRLETLRTGISEVK